MIQKIAITGIDGVKEKVWATVQDGIAIHRAYGKDPEGRPIVCPTYAVTHVESGGLFRHFKDKASAKAYAAKVLAIRYHGISIGSMSGCEICANALALAPLLGSTAGPERTLELASNAAEILACSRRSDVIQTGWVRGDAADFMDWIAKRKERMMR